MRSCAERTVRAFVLTATGILTLLGGSLALADVTQNAGLSLTAGGNDLLSGTGISFVDHTWTGDGTRLDMATYYIRNVVDTNGFTLNLAGGSITNGGLLSTTQNGQPGNIIVTNVSSLDVSGISTVCSNDSVAWTVGSVIATGTDSGNFNVGAAGIQTYYTRGGNSSRAGDVRILNFNSVSVAGSIGTWQGQRYSGLISIGSSSHPIGGAVSISGAVATFTGSDSSAQGAPISIYANGPVSAGELRSAVSRTLNAQNAGCAITVVCRGAFTCGGITNGVDRDAAQTSITVNGTDSSGPFVSGFIDARRTCYQGGHGTPVSITNFSSVAINGGMRADVSACYQGPWTGGNLIVSNITGNITITNGAINLSGARENTGYAVPTPGNLNLFTTGGSITLCDLDMSLVNVASLSCGTICTVTGTLSSVVTNSTLGNGTPASPYQPTQQMLRVASGKVMFYSTNVSGNAYLGGCTYRMPDLAGNAGAGGLLTPVPSSANPGVTILATDGSATEGGDTGMFTVYRTNDASTNADLIVSYSLGGSTVNGRDYQTLPGYVVIPAGSTSATITVTVRGVDPFAQGSTTVIATLIPANYTVGAAGSATVTIADSSQTWQYKAKIRFAGYTRSETLLNFPVLVVLGTNQPAGFQYSAMSSTNGWDLRFGDSTERAVLNYDVDQWATNGNSYVWVQVPVLSGTNDFIWAYWGNVNATSAPAVYSTNGAAWDSGYRGVWHLNQTSGSAIDSTVSRLSGTVNGTVTRGAAGQIGNAFDFDGSSGFVEMGATNVLDLQTANKYTLSAWVYADTTKNGCGVIAEDYNLKSGNSCIQYELGMGVNAGNFKPESGFYYSSWRSAIDSSSLPLTQWVYISGTWDGSTVRVLTNGVVSGSNTVTATIPAQEQAVYIGRRHDGSASPFFDGKIDEVRIEAVARSSNWLWACYQNMVSNDVFSVYSPAISARRISNGTVYFIH